MAKPFPFTVRFGDGTVTRFQDEADQVRAMIRCRDLHEYAYVIWGIGQGYACWRCLSVPMGWGL